MVDVVPLFCLGGGVFFILLAAVGVTRMPDIYLRLSATSKASSHSLS